MPRNKVGFQLLESMHYAKPNKLYLSGAKPKLKVYIKKCLNNLKLVLIGVN